MVLDTRTFGNSLAALSMVNLINEKGLNPRKPARLLNKFNKTISDLDNVDLTTAIHVVKLVYLESHKKCESFEKPLDSYTQNILSTQFKKWQIKKNALGLKKNRKP